MRTKCPFCGSESVKVVDEDLGEDYYECMDCGRTFKILLDGTVII